MIDLLYQLPKWLKLSLVFPLFCLNGWLFVVFLEYCQPLISFLIIATLLAFFLELLIKVLEQWGIRRSLAIATVLFSAVILGVVLGLVIIPTMIDQLSELIQNAPTWVRQASQQLKSLQATPFAQKFSLNINTLIAEATKKLAASIESLGGQALNIAFGTITSLVNVLVIFIFTIFLLAGGESFWDGLFSWLPSPWNARVRFYIYQRFKDYFFSRAILALIASGFRAVIFVIFGIPYSLLFAFGIGIASLVPFLAAVIIIIGSVLLSFNSVDQGIKFFLSALIIDQVTDNVIAPRLMGELIGLNPIWILISLFIGGKLGGILGLFLAVPIASVIKQIVDDLRYSTTLETEKEVSSEKLETIAEIPE